MLDAEALAGPPRAGRRAAPEVLADVLPVLGELQRGADAVRERDPLRRRRAEDVQHELADRIRREVAVVERARRTSRTRSRWSRRFASIRRRNGSRGSEHSRTVAREALQQRVLRLAVEDAVEVPLERVEQREPVAVDLVAELVDESREAVDRGEVSARPAAEEKRGDGEVLARRQRQDRGRVRQPRFGSGRSPDGRGHSPMTWMKIFRGRETVELAEEDALPAAEHERAVDDRDRLRRRREQAGAQVRPAVRVQVVVVEPLGADVEVVVAVVPAVLGRELGEELVEVLDEARTRAR